MIELPCVKFAVDCPFLDGRKGYLVCYGVRGGKKLAALKDCPQLEVARAEWVKANKKAPAATGAKQINKP